MDLENAQETNGGTANRVQKRTILVYIYSSSSTNTDESERIAFEIYSYLRQNATLGDTGIRAVIPKSPEFFNEMQNQRICYLVEIDCKYIDPTE